MKRTSFVAALIGAGVGPSLTPSMHEREGRRHGLTYIYRTVDITTLDLAATSVGELVRAARLLGLDGVNITHPCKQVVLSHLDDLSPSAELLGAVNTVVFNDGRAVGHNTDVSGFAKAFSRGLPDAPVGTVVQVGTGGAGAAVAHALLSLEVKRLLLCDIESSRSEALARSLQQTVGRSRVEALDMADLGTAARSADGIVNATPLGMAHQPGTSVPSGVLRSRLWVADIVYRPVRTALIQAAEERGCRVLTGAGMAVFQAADAFQLITGLDPDPEAMFADFQELVAQEPRPRVESQGAHHA